MGITDKQFNGYPRLVLALLNETDETKRKEKFDKRTDNIKKQ